MSSGPSPGSDVARDEFPEQEGGHHRPDPASGGDRGGGRGGRQRRERQAPWPRHQGCRPVRRRDRAVGDAGPTRANGAEPPAADVPAAADPVADAVDISVTLEALDGAQSGAHDAATGADDAPAADDVSTAASGERQVAYEQRKGTNGRQQQGGQRQQGGGQPGQGGNDPDSRRSRRRRGTPRPRRPRWPARSRASWAVTRVQGGGRRRSTRVSLCSPSAACSTCPPTRATGSCAPTATCRARAMSTCRSARRAASPCARATSSRAPAGPPPRTKDTAAYAGRAFAARSVGACGFTGRLLSPQRRGHLL